VLPANRWRGEAARAYRHGKPWEALHGAVVPTTVNNWLILLLGFYVTQLGLRD
jgi:hypothetical protein